MGLFSSKEKSENEVLPIRKDQAYSWMDRYYGLMDQPREFYPEQTYAGMDPLQTESQQMREQYARGMGGMVDPVMSAWQGTLTAPDVANNPYVQNMLNQQASLLSRNLSENILPGISSGAIGAGQLGSSRQGVAEGLAVGRTQDALARSAAQTQLDAYNRGLAQQQYGLSAAPGMLSLGQAPASMLGAIGAERRAEEQMAIDEDRARFEFEQEEPWQRLERFAGTYFPVTQPYAQRKTTTQTSPSALQVAGQLGGLGLAGMGMYRGYQMGGAPTTGGANYSAYANPYANDPMAYMQGYGNYMSMFR